MTSNSSDTDANMKKNMNLVDYAKDKFWSAAYHGMSEVMSVAPGIWNGPNGKFYREEKRIIENHLDPFYKGAFVTIFLFTTFRITGSRWFTRLRHEHFSSPQQTSNTTGAVEQQTKRATKEWKSYLEKQVEEKDELSKDLIQLPIDILLSIFCGCSSVLFFLRPTDALKDFATLPLVSGGSLVHKYACSKFENEFHQLENDGFDQRTTDDEVVRSFYTFVQNCRLRSEYIRSREDSGAELPDIIPYPGVKLPPR